MIIKKMKYIIKLFKWTLTPQEYREQQAKRYKDNPYAEFNDNYNCGL